MSIAAVYFQLFDIEKGFYCAFFIVQDEPLDRRMETLEELGLFILHW